uniref:Uncharacterized protein n=1 Tax=Aegilops tauschii subsp. strangulata TaxID=200361 RepID=A0A453MD02_AEGTS
RCCDWTGLEWSALQWRRPEQLRTRPSDPPAPAPAAALWSGRPPERLAAAPTRY